MYIDAAFLSTDAKIFLHSTAIEQILGNTLVSVTLHKLQTIYV